MTELGPTDEPGLVIVCDQLDPLAAAFARVGAKLDAMLLDDDAVQMLLDEVDAVQS